MGKIRTTILISAGGYVEHQLEIEVAYSVNAGCQATYTQPGEADTVSLESVTLLGQQFGGNYRDDWLRGILEDDEEILSLCLMDWHEDRIEAAERRAEDRAERLREERL